MKTTKGLIILFYYLLPFICSAQSSPKQHLIEFGELVSIDSKILNEVRDIWVYLPPNYHDTFHEPAQYPVLYILDGDIHFHSISGLIQILSAGLNGTYVIPEMIVIAIPNTDRTRDLTPTRSLKGVDGKDAFWYDSSGGGSNFLNFINYEVIPKIDSSYRTSNYRTIIGQSLGGLTVINALCTIPETFNAYVAIEPSLWWDEKDLLHQISDYLNKSDLTGKTLFLAQANTLSKKDSLNVHYESIKEFLTILETRNQSNLNWEYEYYENDGHASVALIAEYDALRFIFEKFYASIGEIFGPKDLQTHYAELSTDLKIHLIPSERVIHRFGVVAMYSHQPELAEEYFRMNIKYYPNSPSVYADMAQLNENNEMKLKAIEYYKLALSLDITNKYLVNKITSIEHELQRTERRKDGQ